MDMPQNQVPSLTATETNQLKEYIKNNATYYNGTIGKAFWSVKYDINGRYNFEAPTLEGLLDKLIKCLLEVKSL